jgi:uncharacterized protein (TIRG00374 family)
MGWLTLGGYISLMSNNSNDFRIQFNYQSFLVMITLFSLLLIYIAFIGIEDVIFSLLQANILLLILAIVIYYLSLLIRSFRWKYILESLENQNNSKIGYWSIYSLISFSFALNNLFPLRMGELYRPYELTKKHDYSLISSFATIILERTFDVIMMGCLILISAFLQGLENIFYETDIVLNLALSIIIVGVFISLLATLTREKPTYFLVRILNLISNLVQKKVIKDEEQTAQKVSAEVSLLVRNRMVLILGFVYSLIIWLMEGLVFWIVSISMNIHISLLMAIFILLLAGLIGNSITSASGLSQLPFMIGQLVLLANIPQNLALSTSVVYLVIVFWLIIPIATILRELEKFLIKKELDYKKSSSG